LNYLKFESERKLIEGDKKPENTKVLFSPFFSLSFDNQTLN